jgi:rod shape-determining protein MreC
MTSGLLANRATRRRGITFSILVALTLLLMAFSNLGPVQELQRGVGYAFRPFQATLTNAAATVASVVDALGEIDHLRRDNEALRQENQQLAIDNARLQEIKRENEQLTGLLQTRGEVDFQTVATQVIARESSEFRRVVTIDRGSNDGISTGDVVIAAGGALAGRVTDTATTYARVLLINDTSSTVIGSVSASGATGEVVGQLEGALVMRNIDATEQVHINDEVTTAGIELNGGVRSPYPKGLLIGQVVDVGRDANAVVQTAFVRSSADLDKLAYLLVITDYQGGLPPADQQPTLCSGGPDNTVPGGEQPCYTPGPATPKPSPTPKPSVSPLPSPSPSATR